MVTRIDERVEIFMGKIEGVEEDLTKHIDTCPARCGMTEIMTRLGVIESKNGKVLREELLGHVTEQKQIVQKLASKVEEMEKVMISIKSSTDQQAGRWKWIGLFIFNAVFNVVALVGAAWILHIWKVANP